MGVKLLLNHCTFNIITLYFPPGLSLLQYEMVLDDLVESLMSIAGEVMIIGDFYCPGYFRTVSGSHPDRITRLLFDFLDTNNFIQLNRFLNTNKVLLDLCCINCLKLIISLDTVLEPSARTDNHHPPFKLTLTKLDRLKENNVNNVTSVNNSTSNNDNDKDSVDDNDVTAKTFIYNFIKCNLDLLQYEVSFVNWSSLNFKLCGFFCLRYYY